MWENDEFRSQVFLKFAPESSIKITFNEGFTHVWPDGSTGMISAVVDNSHDCYYRNNGTIY